MAGEEEHPRDSPFNCRNRAKGGGVWYKWQGKKNHPRDSPFNCRNRATRGVWYKWQGKKNHPLMELDSFTPTYSD